MKQIKKIEGVNIFVICVSSFTFVFSFLAFLFSSICFYQGRKSLESFSKKANIILEVAQEKTQDFDLNFNEIQKNQLVQSEKNSDTMSEIDSLTKKTEELSKKASEFMIQYESEKGNAEVSLAKRLASEKEIAFQLYSEGRYAESFEHFSYLSSVLDDDEIQFFCAYTNFMSNKLDSSQYNTILQTVQKLRQKNFYKPQMDEIESFIRSELGL